MSANCPACGPNHPKHTGKDCSFGNETVHCGCTAADSRKADRGKARFDLIPAYPMLALARVYEYGSRKYEANSWRDVPDALIKYEAAGMRHYNAWKRGEKIDKESGCTHLSMFLWNVVAMVELDGE